MVYLALATDYDGTIAHHGRVDDATIEGLRRIRSRGLRLILVTGRDLPSLFRTFADSDLFDRIVAENGAVLYEPATMTSRRLSSPPPPELVAALQAQGVPISVGQTIVATVEPHEQSVLSAIRDLGLEWHVIFNKGAVMALPSATTKATGLSIVLRELGISPAATIGIGDAENDHAFLELCGLSIAVANALPAVKATADMTTKGAHGEGVVEVIDRLLADPALAQR
jgi:hydroxymethylpyrimidine pyrophosphatase-like HAD family hydrolase